MSRKPYLYIIFSYISPTSISFSFFPKYFIFCLLDFCQGILPSLVICLYRSYAASPPFGGPYCNCLIIYNIIIYYTLPNNFSPFLSVNHFQLTSYFMWFVSSSSSLWTRTISQSCFESHKSLCSPGPIANN